MKRAKIISIVPEIKIVSGLQRSVQKLLYLLISQIQTQSNFFGGGAYRVIIEILAAKIG